MFIVAVFGLFLSACAVDRTYGAADNIEVTELSSLPEPEALSYGLHAFDEVEVAVLQDTSLNGTYQLDGDGSIAFPYIGSVKAAGLTPNQLASALANRLSPQFVRDPDVTVRSTTASVQTLSMGGEIAKPGNYPVQGAQTLLRAVNLAGGPADYAKLEDVLIFRQVGGVQYIGLYNLAAIQRGNYADPTLAPGDIVMIGDNPARRRLERIFSFIPILSTTAILIDRIAK